MLFLLYDEESISPIIDNIIDNNEINGNQFKGKVPFCRTGYVIDYILENRKINRTLPAQEVELSDFDSKRISDLINVECDCILKSNTKSSGLYFTTAYGHNRYSTFRIENVDTTRPWTILREVCSKKEVIWYLNEYDAPRFKCYVEKYNYYLPIKRCNEFQRIDKTNNLLCEGSTVEVLRNREITRRYADGHVF